MAISWPSSFCATGRLGLPAAKVRERLGALDSEKAISLIAFIRIKFRMSSAARPSRAEQARPASLSHREDWRAIPLVTIDPEDAKDHDDAVHAEHDPDPANPALYSARRYR